MGSAWAIASSIAASSAASSSVREDVVGVVTLGGPPPCRSAWKPPDFRGLATLSRAERTGGSTSRPGLAGQFVRPSRPLAMTWSLTSAAPLEERGRVHDLNGGPPHQWDLVRARTRSHVLAGRRFPSSGRSPHRHYRGSYRRFCDRHRHHRDRRGRRAACLERWRRHTGSHRSREQRFIGDLGRVPGPGLFRRAWPRSRRPPPWRHASADRTPNQRAARPTPAPGEADRWAAGLGEHEHVRETRCHQAEIGHRSVSPFFLEFLAAPAGYVHSAAGAPVPLSKPVARIRMSSLWPLVTGLHARRWRHGR